MKKLTLLLSAVAMVTGTSAMAIDENLQQGFHAGRFGVLPKSICTRDYNEWGNASICACDESFFDYDQRSGYCVTQTEARQVVLDGVVEVTETGFSLVFDSGEETQMITRYTSSDALMTLVGTRVTVEGEYMILAEEGRYQVGPAVVVESFIAQSF